MHIDDTSFCIIIPERQKLLSWTSCKSTYCNLICAQIKEKRIEWAKRYLHDGFEDVVWMDKTTVQLETVFAIVRTWADASLQASAETLVFVLKLCLLCAAYLQVFTWNDGCLQIHCIHADCNASDYLSRLCNA